MSDWYILPDFVKANSLILLGQFTLRKELLIEKFETKYILITNKPIKNVKHKVFNL